MRWGPRFCGGEVEGEYISHWTVKIFISSPSSLSTFALTKDSNLRFGLVCGWAGVQELWHSIFTAYSQGAATCLGCQATFFV